jgi:DNA repair ATPase RecN
MKKLMLIIFICSLGLCTSYHLAAQAQELEELALDIEKLAQFKQILSDLKAGYQVLEGGYNTIKGISQGNFSLHKTYLDGLLAISPAVAKYKKIVTITENQLQLIKEYKNAYKRFQHDGNFNPDEIEYIGKVYSNLADESAKNLESLLNVVTANKLRMSDDERLKAIDLIDEEIENKLSFLRYFNNNTTVLSRQRTKQRNDVNTSRLLHAVSK